MSESKNTELMDVERMARAKAKERRSLHPIIDRMLTKATTMDLSDHSNGHSDHSDHSDSNGSGS